MNDLDIARRYINKAANAKQNNIQFELSFTSFKNLMKAKKCGYTGIKLTTPRGGGCSSLCTDRTIDRIDSQLGYISGNVIAVCSAANSFKAIWENPNNPLKASHTKKMLKKLGI
jgi:hypothetical protein